MPGYSGRAVNTSEYLSVKGCILFEFYEIFLDHPKTNMISNNEWEKYEKKSGWRIRLANDKQFKEDVQRSFRQLVLEDLIVYRPNPIYSGISLTDRGIRHASELHNAIENIRKVETLGR